MTVKVLVIDPEMSFSIAIKRALETTGDYKVSIFASGKAGLELLRRDSHDVAILDFEIDDIALPDLIESVRRVQPWIFLIASTHSGEHLESAATLDIQGTITKPYYARQLVPVIRAAAENLTRQTRHPSERMQELAQLADIQGNQPDEMFEQVIHSGDTGKMLAVSPASQAPEPPIPDDATVRQLVSGKTTPIPTEVTPTEAAPTPDVLPEGESLEKHETALVAEMALEIAQDDTVPFDGLSEALAERVETIPPEDRPSWIPALDPDQPTVVGPSVSPARVSEEPPFVASVGEETVQYEFPLAPPALSDTENGTVPALNLEEVFADLDQPSDAELDEQTDAEMALTFAGLLPPDERPELLDQMSEDDQMHAAALSVLGPEAIHYLHEPDEDEIEHVEPHTVAQLLDRPATPPSDSDPIAAAALQLTQLAVSSSAQISLLSRADSLVAIAGLLPERDVKVLLDEINKAWQASESGENPARFRYIQLPNGSDYLMYSIRTLGEMVLTMLFPGDIPLRMIRKQARELSDTLEKVPAEQETPEEVPAEPQLPPEPRSPTDALPLTADSEAATTLLSRPTAMRPPPELQEALAATEPAPPEQIPEVAAPPPPPPVVYSTYGFMWLPRSTALDPDMIGMVTQWLHHIAEQNGWRIEGADIQPSYIVLQMAIPASEQASAALQALVQQTAQRAQNPTLFGEAYYITPSGRTITPREIAEFMEYCRELQNAR